MADPSQAILSALERDDGGIAIIWCPADVGLRDWLVDEVQSLAPRDARPLRVATVEDALARPDEMVLLVPEIDAEEDAVLDLNGSRDRIFNEARPRTQQIVLFLFREGVGQAALAQAPSLRSITDGSDPDPDALAEVDVASESAAFLNETGKRPEDWLILWRQDELPHTAENFSLAYRAMLLEGA